MDTAMNTTMKNLRLDECQTEGRLARRFSFHNYSKNPSVVGKRNEDESAAAVAQKSCSVLYCTILGKNPSKSEWSHTRTRVNERER